MKEKYYYFREPKTKKPSITVCLIEKNGAIARGTAICSKLDNIDKGYARIIAKGRAEKSLKTRIDRCCINRPEPLDIVYDCIPDINDAQYSAFMCCKAMFNPELTDFEKKIMGV
jgi:hypothetical protein